VPKANRTFAATAWPRNVAGGTVPPQAACGHQEVVCDGQLPGRERGQAQAGHNIHTHLVSDLETVDETTFEVRKPTLPNDFAILTR